jgi:hypothetical protein
VCALHDFVELVIAGLTRNPMIAVNRHHEEKVFNDYQGIAGQARNDKSSQARNDKVKKPAMTQ